MQEKVTASGRLLLRQIWLGFVLMTFNTLLELVQKDTLLHKIISLFLKLEELLPSALIERYVGSTFLPLQRKCKLLVAHLSGALREVTQTNVRLTSGVLLKDENNNQMQLGANKEAVHCKSICL